MLWGLTWGDTIRPVHKVPSGCWGRVEGPECHRGIKEPLKVDIRDSREKLGPPGGRTRSLGGQWGPWRFEKVWRALVPLPTPQVTSAPPNPSSRPRPRPRPTPPSPTGDAVAGNSPDPFILHFNK